jgi:DNA repair protein RecO (recombination protein O)
MPGLYKDEGVVLRTIKLGEADRIITLFTRANGKVRAVAKGVRKTKSRFGGRLEPFTRLRLVIYRGRDLDTITSADVVCPFKEIRSDYVSLTSAAALSELVDKVLPDRERAVSVYDLLLSGLDAIVRDPSSTVVPAFAVKLLSVSGFHPQLSVCAGCGEGGYLEGFSAALGGVVCERCWIDDDGAFRIGPDRIALLSRLLASEFGQSADADAAREVTEALRRYAEYHLERPLRSLQLLLAT